jgi:hypothetical protein
MLTEAERILEKHLCTLEPGISLAQTDEMDAQAGSPASFSLTVLCSQYVSTPST